MTAYRGHPGGYEEAEQCAWMHWARPAGDLLMNRTFGRSAAQAFLRAQALTAWAVTSGETPSSATIPRAPENCMPRQQPRVTGPNH